MCKWVQSPFITVPVPHPGYRAGTVPRVPCRYRTQGTVLVPYPGYRAGTVPRVPCWYRTQGTVLVPFPLVSRARDVFCARRILLRAPKRGEGKKYFSYSPGPLFNARKIRTIIIVLAIAMRGGGELMRGTAPRLHALGRTLLCMIILRKCNYRIIKMRANQEVHTEAANVLRFLKACMQSWD